MRTSFCSLLIAGSFLLAAAQGEGAQCSISVDHVSYQDGSGRNIGYDFSSGQVTVMGGWRQVEIPESAVAGRPVGEESTTYLWGEYGWGTSSAAQLTGGALIIPMEKAQKEGDDFQEKTGWAIGAYGSVAGASGDWTFELELKDFQGVEEGRYLSANLGGGGWDVPIYPGINATWFTGWYGGTYYENQLFISADLWNDEQGDAIWESSEVSLSGLNPLTTTVGFKIQVTGGNSFTAFYRLNGGGWVSLGGATSPSPINSLPSLFPYVDLSNGLYFEKTNGLYHVRQFVQSDPPDRSYLNEAAVAFQLEVNADPTDYTARVYNAVARLANLMNDPDLLGLMEQFGVTVPQLLTNLTGEISFDGAPLSDDLLDQVCGEVLPVIDSAFADLNAIPINWAGTAEISSVYFPVDETVYVDIGDVLVGKAMLKGLRSFLQTLQAYQLDVNYNRLIYLVDSSVASITVDGQTNDWAGVSPQLIGSDNSGLQTIQTAYDADFVYVLVKHCNSDLNNSLWINGELYLGIESDISWYYGSRGYSTIRWSASGAATGDASRMIFMNGVFEARFEIPNDVVVTNVSVDKVGMHWESDSGWWESDELLYPNHTKANSWVEGHPGFGASVQSPALMASANNDLKTAIGYMRQADSLIVNRTDGLLHFIEYDASYTNERTQFFAGLDDVEASLSGPVDLVPSDYDATATSEDSLSVYLGAFYQAPYLTRAMLPQFEDSALLGDNPILNSYPDPTFGGIFPELSQRNLANLQLGLPFDLMLNAPAAASISTEQWPSKIQISWGVVSGADSYEIYRSLTSNIANAELISTTTSAGYTDSGLDRETTYYYWVRAVNAAGPGDFNTAPMAGSTSAAFAMPWLNLLLDDEPGTDRSSGGGADDNDGWPVDGGGDIDDSDVPGTSV